MCVSPSFLLITPFPFQRKTQTHTHTIVHLLFSQSLTLAWFILPRFSSVLFDSPRPLDLRFLIHRHPSSFFTSTRSLAISGFLFLLTTPCLLSLTDNATGVCLVENKHLYYLIKWKRKEKNIATTGIQTTYRGGISFTQPYTYRLASAAPTTLRLNTST